MRNFAKNINQDNLPLGRNWKLGPRDYEVEILAIPSRGSNLSLLQTALQGVFLKSNLVKLLKFDSSWFDFRKEIKNKGNHVVPKYFHISFSKNYYEIRRSFQLSYRKNPNYVDRFSLWDRVELGCILKVVGENNPTNFDPEN
jgi:hypothetical protein